MLTFTDFGQVAIILRDIWLFGQDIWPQKKKKKSKPPLDNKFNNHTSDLAQVIFNNSINKNQELGSLDNK